MYYSKKGGEGERILKIKTREAHRTGEIIALIHLFFGNLSGHGVVAGAHDCVVCNEWASDKTLDEVCWAPLASDYIYAYTLYIPIYRLTNCTL